MMHLEILSEDRSGGVVLSAVLDRLRRQRRLDFTFSIRPHRGKGYVPRDLYRPPARDALALQDLLPAKARAYARVMDPHANLLVVVMDSDELPYEEVEKNLRGMLLPYTDGLRHVLGVCVEEMEAWLLGDPTAVRKAYPQADLHRLKAYRQDSVCGTWEWLARCVAPERADHLIRIGYPAVGQYKLEWCREISRHMDPERNASPSFRRFLHRLEQALAESGREPGSEREHA